MATTVTCSHLQPGGLGKWGQLEGPAGTPHSLPLTNPPQTTTMCCGLGSEVPPRSPWKSSTGHTEPVSRFLLRAGFPKGGRGSRVGMKKQAATSQQRKKDHTCRGLKVREKESCQCHRMWGQLEREEGAGDRAVGGGFARQGRSPLPWTRAYGKRRGPWGGKAAGNSALVGEIISFRDPQEGSWSERAWLPHTQLQPY